MINTTRAMDCEIKNDDELQEDDDEIQHDFKKGSSKGYEYDKGLLQ